MERGAPAARPAGGVLTVADLWEVYDRKHVSTVVGPQTLRYNWANLKPHFGALVPSAIDQDVADRYVEKRSSGALGKPAKDSTIRKELRALRSCLSWHAKPERGAGRLLGPGDVPVFTLPDEGEPRDRWLNTDELRALFAAARKMRPGKTLTRGERFLWLGLETAARKQAILDLTWDRVDFEIGVIHYDVPGRRKTKKGRATVPISSALRPVLERAYRERENDLVMTNKGDVWATVQLIAINAGLGGAQKNPPKSCKPRATGVSPHVLRHTAATWMARRGVPLFTIAKVLGNTVAVVEKTYAKWVPGNPDESVNHITNGNMEAAE